MSELGSGIGTGYPGAIDTDSSLEVNSPAANKTKARAEVPNDLASAIIAVETELGTDPAGDKTNVKTFLQVEHNTDGTHNIGDFSGATHTHLTDGTGGTLQFLPVRDTSRGLIIKNGTTADEDVDVDADEIILQDSSGIPKSVTSVNLTIDNTASGINGLDTGSVGNSTWYYIWVLNGSSGTGGVISTASSFGSVTKPSGYDTYGALVGAILTDGTADFLVTYQIGDAVRCKNGSITVSDTSATSRDISAYIPTTAKMVNFVWTLTATSNATSLHIHPVTFTVADGTTFFQAYGGDASYADIGQGQCPVETASTIFAAILSGGGTPTVYFQGWSY